MHFRYARHTDNLSPLIQFYTEVIGLKILGTFKNHSNYNGVFIGNETSDWHLEFTTSKEPVKHQIDEDDLLVFYLETAAERQAIVATAKARNIPVIKAKNPYWEQYGIIY